MADARSSVSLPEIASLAEVTPAAVSNWRRRYDDFPSPLATGGRESFRAAEVASWLDQRKIPQNALGKYEPDGSSYGDRFRRNAGMIPTRDIESPDIGQILWRQLDRLRGVLDTPASSDLVLTLLYIRTRYPQAWRTVVERAYLGGHEVELAISDALAADHWLQGMPSSLAGAIGQTADAHRLVPIIQAIDSVGPGEGERSPIIASAFSDLLANFAAAEGRKGGEFYTPESIVKLAVQLLAPSPTDQIYDPCCGTGGFLVGAADYLLQQGNDAAELSISGMALTAQSSRLANMNLHLRGLEAVIQPDAVASLQRGRPERRYDVVLANPPFNMADWSHDGQALSGHWRYGRPPEHNANFAWLQYVISSLRPGGRAAVIMPNGAGFSENTQEREIRAAMLEDRTVSAVIALPTQLFASTTIPVTMWLLQSPDVSSRDEVLFLDATEMGTMRERTRRVLSRSDSDKIVNFYFSWRDRSTTGESGFAASVDLSMIRKARYRLNPREYVAPPTATVDRTEAVATVDRLRHELHGFQQQAARIDEVVDQHLKRIQLWKP